jgi:glycosyltransferase involved in cell wall biosynthesis
LIVQGLDVRHIGLSLGRVEHWHDGLGEFSRQLGLTLSRQAPQLADELGWRLHFHLPRRWHGVFGDAVGYLDSHTTQRFVHLTRTRFALWHILHQHNRLRAPLGTARQVETVHDLNFLHAKTPAKVERYRARLRRRLTARDAVIAITHHVAGDIGRELPGLTTPVHVIHNGVTDLTAADRQAVPNIGSEPFLLHISRMAPSKNIVALLDLAAAWPEQRLVLAGATSTYIDEVRRQVSTRALRNVSIHLDLSEAQKAWLYAHCTGFVFPSLAEGFGLPPLEAMHFGKPVFLSRLTSLPEVGGDAAHYFDSFDGAAMRAVIEAGLADHQAPGRAAAVAAHARSFNWQRCGKAHLALYRTLVP